MFQFSGLALFRVIYLQYTRLSHSEIFGSIFVCNYPKLIAAYHVLHRLLVPRHPPCALICFKKVYSLAPSGGDTTSLLLVQLSRGDNERLLSQYVKDLELLRAAVMSVELNHWCCLSATSLSLHNYYPHTLLKKSGGYRSRTDDPLRARQML